MGCCGERVEEGNRPPPPKGPVKNRGCTDIFFLGLFVAFLIGWAIVSSIAIINGNLDQIFHPTDSKGNICGVGKLATQKYLFYFDIMKCASTSVLITGCPTPQVCVTKCPDYNYAAVDPGADLIKDKDKLICKYEIDLNKYESSASLRSLIDKGDCAPYYISSSAMVGRCLPTYLNGTSYAFVDAYNRIIKTPNGTIVTPSLLSQASKSLGQLLNNVSEKIFMDFKSCWWLIIIGILFAMILSFIWIILIRFLGGLMVWFSLIAMIVLFTAGGGYSFYKYKDLQNVPGSEAPFEFHTDFKYYLQLRNTWLAFGIVAAVLLFLILLIVIFLRTRIRIAIALINESSRQVSSFKKVLQ